MATTRHTWQVAVGLALLVAMAGCGGILPNDGSTGATETGSTARDQTETTTPTTPPYAEISSRFQPRADAILLDLSDLATEYDLSGERLLIRENASTQVESDLRSADILIRFERSFTPSPSATDQPSVVLSSVTVYENNETAQEQLESLTSAIETENSGEQVTVLGNYSAQQYQFENDQGAQNTMIIRRTGPIVYYVVTSDSETMHQAYTQELFRTMLRGELVDLEN